MITGAATNILQMLHTTTAYQAAAMQLMVNEANFTAQQLGINETVPPPAAIGTNNWDVAPPPRGIGGSVRSAYYEFYFLRGKLQSVQKTDWFRRISPPIADLADLAERPSLVDRTSAYQLATQWLASLSVDVPALEKRESPVIFQVPGRKRDVSGNYRRDPDARVEVPLFELGWGENSLPAAARQAIETRLHDTEHPPSPAAREAIEARLRDSTHPVRPSPSSAVYMRILGTTKELLSLELRDPALSARPVLQLTNADDLLGPIPPPRTFVENLVGGKEAYQTIAEPEKVEAWLLTSLVSEAGYAQSKRDRAGPVQLKSEVAKEFSDALLEFNSYLWIMSKNCIVDFGARLRFTRGRDVVDVRLCYECDELQFIHNGRSQLADFDPAHDALVKALQGVFDDRIVNGLPLKGR